MESPSHDVLAVVGAVRRRMRLAAGVRGAFAGLLVGCAVVVLVSRTRLPVLEHNPLAVVPFSPVLAVLALALFTAVAAAVAASRRVTSLDAAAAVDAAVRLQDRTNSAVDFMARHREGPLVALQIGDASAHIAGVSPRNVVGLVPAPVRRRAAWALGAVALVAAFIGGQLLVPEPTPAAVEPDLAVIEAGNHLEEVVQSMRELAQDPRLEEAKELLDALEQLADRLAQGAMTRKAVLSEVTKIQDTAESREARTHKELRSVREALKEAAKELQDDELTRELARAMLTGRFTKAGLEMEKLADALKQLDSKRMLMRKTLAKAAERMDAAELAELSDRLLKASQFLDAKDMEAAEFEMDMAAMELMNLEDLETLEAMLGRIKDGCMMCKPGLRGGKMRLAKGTGGGMQMNLPLRSVGTGGAHKSNSPSLSAGTATDTDPFRHPSEIGAERHTENVPGEPGKEGDTFVEISKVADSKETGSAAYRDVFAEYAKTALESLSYEKIPLGYRYYVRRYFEGIRPTVPASEPPDGVEGNGAE